VYLSFFSLFSSLRHAAPDAFVLSYARSLALCNQSVQFADGLHAEVLTVTCGGVDADREEALASTSAFPGASGRVREDK
jgi:hypothetical protein